jgi:hypothetical protein
MPLYVIRLEEVGWGCLLLAVTLVIHGLGMMITLRVANAIKDRFKESMSISLSLGIVILASWMIILTSLVEIWAWSEFFVFMGALPNRSVAIYYTLVNYTTLDSGYLPQRWHLLEGLLAMAGLLTLAWSTGILYTLIEDFRLQALHSRREAQERKGTPDAH